MSYEQVRGGSMKRFVVSTAMLALGVAFGAAAYALPDAKAPRRGAIREGGVFRVSIGFEFVKSIDPVLVVGPEWEQVLEVTCAKLMNNPDKGLPAGLRVVPEVAAGYPRVSPDGKGYKFTLRRGFRFSNGVKLDARGFARSIERIRELKPDSWVQDIAGVVARGTKLTIRLEQPIPFFTIRLATAVCAVPPNLPADPEGVPAPLHSAGPYYVAEYVPGRKVVLRRNPNYGGKRPHHVARFEVRLTSPAETLKRLERGAADWTPHILSFAGERMRELVRRYERSGRLSFKPQPAIQFWFLNTERPLFRGNARLRRAVNFAVDRTALVRETGFRVARPTDQYLPPGFPGFQEARIYPFRPNLKRAKALARGRLRGGKAVLYVPTRFLPLAQVVKSNLAKIGLAVEITAIPGPNPYFERVRTREEPYDIAWYPWLADYNDPYTFINQLLHGREIGRLGSANFSYFNSPKYNRRMDRASRLPVPARYRAYAKLDRQLARDAAPLVAYDVLNEPTLVSARVDPRCKILRPRLDLAAVCLKR
jgi:ABC-type transport system substrate-binding protein